MSSRRLWIAIIALVLGWTAVAPADTVVLKDGTIIEGKIVRETPKYVKIDTKHGGRSISRKKIERIVRESAEGSAVHAIRTIKEFSALDEIAQALKNAQALYDLERFDEIPDRVEKYIGKGAKYDDMRIRWMLIETYERQGKWELVEELLNKTMDDGREPDKIRAKAHLDLFEQNPGHMLRDVGDRRAKEFLSRELRNLGKKVGALQHRELMEAALLEYLDQILQNEKVSAETFRDNLDVEQTLAAIRAEIEKDSRDVVRALPYVEDMRKVESSLYRANAILPGYVVGYELDVVRTEAEHLDEVIRTLLNDLSNADPDSVNVAADEHGRLTKEGREQWREACNEFIDLTRPIVQLVEHLLIRVRPYPVEMREFIKDWEDTLERVEQMRTNAMRRRERTRI